MLERGPYVSYANCGLPYFLSRDIEQPLEAAAPDPRGLREPLRGEGAGRDRGAGDRPRRASGSRVKVPRARPGSPTTALILAQGGSPVIPGRRGHRRSARLPPLDRSRHGPDPRLISRRSRPRRSSPAAASSGWRWPRPSPPGASRTTVVELLPRVMSHDGPRVRGLDRRAARGARGPRRHGDVGVTSVHAEPREVRALRRRPLARRPGALLRRRASRAGPRPAGRPHRRRASGGLAVDEHLQDLRSAHLGRGRHERDRAQGLGPHGADSPRGARQPPGPDRGHERARRVAALRGRPRLERREGLRRHRRAHRPDGEDRARGGLRRAGPRSW